MLFVAAILLLAVVAPRAAGRLIFLAAGIAALQALSGH